MAKFANIRPEQINKARRMLQDLPEKTERKTRQEAALLLESDLRKALKKGYGPKELCALLKNEGIIIPAYLIRQFCSENGGEFVRTLFRILIKQRIVLCLPQKVRSFLNS